LRTAIEPLLAECDNAAATADGDLLKAEISKETSPFDQVSGLDRQAATGQKAVDFTFRDTQINAFAISPALA
jgi:hypothetical protein